MYIPENFTMETFTIYPTSSPKITTPPLCDGDGEEPIEKRGKTGDSTVIFNIELPSDHILHSCYLYGRGVPQYESVAIYETHGNVKMVEAKRSDIEQYVEFAYSEQKREAYRKMATPFHDGLNVFHPLIIPSQELQFDHTGHPVIQTRDKAEECLTRWSVCFKKFRFEFEMPYGWTGNCELSINVKKKKYYAVNEQGYPTN